MNKLFLILPLAALLFATEGWAPPPGKGGATAGPEFNTKTCDLKPKEQTKIELKDRSGKSIHICTGLSVCGNNLVPVSCKVSEKEPCPIAKKCIEFTRDIILKECTGKLNIRVDGHDFELEVDNCRGSIAYAQSHGHVDIKGYAYILRGGRRTTDDYFEFHIFVNVYQKTGQVLLHAGRRKIYTFAIEDTSGKQTRAELNGKEYKFAIIKELKGVNNNVIKAQSGLKGIFP
ncbi:MAG: hypothetical protein DRQ88_01415 [Epsilonproteobacteria bacterium]|nr:MAG: hypothetical protein DRQ89_05485 [Campylobacterota bacterium]RLA67951.1 MAG: hypothetical protein DRQ88_01415 [Campylobacterota bacterium]